MISVVIPLYNKAETIGRTLLSVLNQTFTEFEIVIVNDGSTDNGVDVIKKLSPDPRIRIIEQQNQGVSVARNKGVSEAKYDFMSFLDGDDEWMPGYLDQVSKMIHQFPQAGMYCMAGIVRANGYDHFRLAKQYTNKVVELNYFQSPFVFSHTSATTVARKYFNQTNGFPVGVKNFQDFYLFTAMALISKVIYCGIPLSIYMGNVAGQATSSVSFASKLGFRAGYLNEFTHAYLKTKNRQLIIWLRAFSRNEIWFMLKSSQFDNLREYISKMDDVTQQECLGIGRTFYSKKQYYPLSLLHIFILKSLHMLRGYPKVNFNKGKIKTTLQPELQLG